MTEHPAPHNHFAPGPALPDPAQASGPTRWGAPSQDYAADASTSSSWADADPPAAVPPLIPGIEGPQTRPRWLTAGRTGGDGA